MHCYLAFWVVQFNYIIEVSHAYKSRLKSLSTTNDIITKRQCNVYKRAVQRRRDVIHHVFHHKCHKIHVYRWDAIYCVSTNWAQSIVGNFCYPLLNNSLIRDYLSPSRIGEIWLPLRTSTFGCRRPTRNAVIQEFFLSLCECLGTFYRFPHRYFFLSFYSFSKAKRFFISLFSITSHHPPPNFLFLWNNGTKETSPTANRQ